MVNALAGLALVLMGALGSAHPLPVMGQAAAGASPGARGEGAGDAGQSVPRTAALPGRRNLPNLDAEQQARAEAGGARPGGAAAGGPVLVWGQRREEGAAGQALHKMQPLEAALAQLPQVAEAYGVGSLTELGATLSYTSTDELGVTVVRLEQQVEGIDVFHGALSLLLDRDNRLVAAVGTLAPAAPRAKGLGTHAFTLQAREAIARAYGDLTGEALDAGLLREKGPAGGDATAYAPTALVRPELPAFAEDARARRVLYPLGEELVPAWYLEVAVAAADPADTRAYAYVVSARDGQLLMRQDLTHDAGLTFRAWGDAAPPYTPQDGPTGTRSTPYPRQAFDPQAVLLPYAPEGLVTLPRAPNPRGDVWLPEGATTSSGNNVRAYADLAPPDGFVEGTGDVMATTSAPDAFDHPFDLEQQPDASRTQQMASVSQLFYVTNWLHDWFYAAGFDEASGNAQQDNYGRGGVEGDPLLAEAQDFSGLNNANMRVPADGASPVMQMYLFRNVLVGLDVTAPADIAGRFPVNGSAVGPQAFDVSGEVVRAEPTDDCRTLRNAAQVAGRIALVSWATPGCTTVDMLLGAQQAGPAGILLIYNEGPNPDATPFVSGTLSGFVPPVLVVSRNTAATFDAQARSGQQVTAHMSRQQAVDLDGSLDNAIVAHEWAHFLSNRLIADASGLGNNQGRALGEGWSDFVALLLMVREEDAGSPDNVNWTGAWPVASYAARALWGPWADYYGIRRTPYSVDRAKNALSLRHIAEGAPLPTSVPMLALGSNSEVHNAGEVWATMLWECYVSLLRAHPFAEAQRRMKSYLVTGLKLTPAFPTFTDARDGVLMAALAADPADFERLSAAFASRGAGVGAVAPERWSTRHEGVVESTAVGGEPRVGRVWVSDDADPAHGCDRDGVLDSGEAGTLHVSIDNVGWRALQAATVTVTSRTPGVVLPGGPVRLEPLPALSRVVAHLPVRLEGVTQSHALLEFSIDVQDPAQVGAGPATATFAVYGNYDAVADASRLETVEAAPALLPWTQAREMGLAEASWAPVPFGAANNAFWGADHGARADFSLVSPPLQVGSEPLVLSFRHAWQFEADPGNSYDGAVLELSRDEGATWEDIGGKVVSGPGYGGVLSDCCQNPLATRRAFVGRSPDWPQLQTTTLALGTDYANQRVRVRFRVGTDASGGAEGWYVDDIEVRGITNTPFASLQPDDGVCPARRQSAPR